MCALNYRPNDRRYCSAALDGGGQHPAGALELELSCFYLRRFMASVCASCACRSRVARVRVCVCRVVVDRRSTARTCPDIVHKDKAHRVARVADSLTDLRASVRLERTRADSRTQIVRMKAVAAAAAADASLRCVTCCCCVVVVDVVFRVV